MFKTGDDFKKELEKEKQEAEEQRSTERSIKRNRFWLPPGKGTQAVFLDDFRGIVKEHQVWDGKSWRQWETCTYDEYGECPLCDAVNNGSSHIKPARKCMPTTVIDLAEYTNRGGEIVKATKKLLVPYTMESKERYLKKMKKNGLNGKQYTIERSSDSRSPNIGTEIDLDGDADWEDVKKKVPTGVTPDEWLMPFDYHEVFKAKTPKELRSLYSLDVPVGENESEADTSGVDDLM